MRKFQILLALLTLAFTQLAAQDKWYVTLTQAPQMNNAGYDALFAKFTAAGLANSYSEYHAAGPLAAGGYLGFTTFSSKNQLEARLAALQPIMGNTVAPVPYECYKVAASPNPGVVTDQTVIVHSDVKGMTEAQYDKVVAALSQQGLLGNPAQLYHVAYKTPEGLKVLDVWSSVAAFEAFGQKLVPILQSVGVAPQPPVVSSVHAIRIPSQADRQMDVVRTDYAAFGRGDIATILASVTPDCQWSHVGNPAVIPFAGTFAGPAGVGQFFENVGKSIQITRFEPGNFRIVDNTVACSVLISGTVIATGKVYTNTVEQTFTFDPNYKVKMWATTGDVSGLEAAFSK